MCYGHAFAIAHRAYIHKEGMWKWNRQSVTIPSDHCILIKKLGQKLGTIQGQQQWLNVPSSLF